MLVRAIHLAETLDHRDKPGDDDRIAGVLQRARQQTQPVLGGLPLRHLAEGDAHVAAGERERLYLKHAGLHPLIAVRDLAEILPDAGPRHLGVAHGDVRLQHLRQRLAEGFSDLRLRVEADGPRRGVVGLQEPERAGVVGLVEVVDDDPERELIEQPEEKCRRRRGGGVGPGGGYVVHREESMEERRPRGVAGAARGSAPLLKR